MKKLQKKTHKMNSYFCIDISLKAIKRTDIFKAQKGK